MDWCSATDRDTGNAGLPEVESFLADLPCSPATATRRTREIRTALGIPSAAAVLTCAADAVDPERLTELSVYGWPHGVRGRRDGFALVALSMPGMTRRLASRLTTADIVIDRGQIRLAGHVLRSTGSPGHCPVCAVSRWLRLLALLEVKGWRGVRAVMAGRCAERAGDQEMHDCLRPIPSQWAGAQLLPSIDRWGWITPSPLSVRSMKAIRNQPVAESVSESLPGSPAEGPRLPFSRRAVVVQLSGLDALLSKLDREATDGLNWSEDLLSGRRSAG